jgi:hypothetical protein
MLNLVSSPRFMWPFFFSIQIEGVITANLPPTNQVHNFFISYFTCDIHLGEILALKMQKNNVYNNLYDFLQ